MSEINIDNYKKLKNFDIAFDKNFGRLILVYKDESGKYKGLINQNDYFGNWQPVEEENLIFPVICNPTTKEEYKSTFDALIDRVLTSKTYMGNELSVQDAIKRGHNNKFALKNEKEFSFLDCHTLLSFAGEILCETLELNRKRLDKNFIPKSTQGKLLATGSWMQSNDAMNNLYIDTDLLRESATQSIQKANLYAGNTYQIGNKQTQAPTK